MIGQALGLADEARVLPRIGIRIDLEQALGSAAEPDPALGIDGYREQLVVGRGRVRAARKQRLYVTAFEIDNAHAAEADGNQAAMIELGHAEQFEVIAEIGRKQRLAELIRIRIAAGQHPDFAGQADRDPVVGEELQPAHRLANRVWPDIDVQQGSTRSAGSAKSVLADDPDAAVGRVGHQLPHPVTHPIAGFCGIVMLDHVTALAGSFPDHDAVVLVGDPDEFFIIDLLLGDAAHDVAAD